MTAEDAKKARPNDKIKLTGLRESLEKYPYNNGDILIVNDPPTEIIDKIFFIRVVANPGRILPKYAEFVSESKQCSCKIEILLYRGCQCGGV